MTRQDLIDALQSANVRAFLHVIRQGESGQGDDAYTIRFGGSHFDAPPWRHPRTKMTLGRYTSSAAGAYQFLASTWDDLVLQFGFEDFSPDNQDQAAVALIARRGALQDVIEGSFEEAVKKCAREWASLPSSPYGQPTLTMDEARQVFAANGGVASGDALA